MRYRMLILLICVTGFAWGQSDWLKTTYVGIAVEDVENASLLNMAALGVKNASGIGLSGHWQGVHFETGMAHLALGPFAYNFRSFSKDETFISDHEVGLGFRINNGIYAGTSFRWNNEKIFGWNIHTLFRPTKWVSLAINTNSLVSKLPYSLDLGVGFRPFSSNDYWGTRLTLFYDGAVSGTSYQNGAVGLRSSPIDGLDIYGHWNFRSENFVVGVKLSWNRLLIGAEMPMTGNMLGKSATTQIFVSANQLRSLPLKSKPKMIIYDWARMLKDTPTSSSFANSFRSGKTLSVYDFLVDMDELSSMRNVDAVLFRNQDFETSFSNLYEIEMAIKRVKESGKKIYFYSDNYKPLQYALAAGVADEIIINPHGSLSVQGFAQNKLYFKNFLAKYGIAFHNFQSHEYKTTFNALSESSMTNAERESLEYVYEALQNEMDRMIEEGREDKLNEELEDIYAKGFWMNANRAQQAGLVDSQMYPDELDKMIEDDFRLSSYHERGVVQYDWEPAVIPVIAVIYANGYIYQGEGWKGKNIGAESLVEAIRAARKNPLIKAIVLRINSGGGSALASNLIAREIALCVSDEKNRKPVVISMAGVAASGGYLISSPGTKIFATPATISGSIGVISIIPNISGLLKHLEIGTDTVAMAESADFPNIFRPLSEAELTHISDVVMKEYDDFVSAVAIGRNSTNESIETVAEGRIWSGAQALDRGLVDELGGLTEAIEAAKEGIKKDTRIIEINPGLTSMQRSLEIFGIQQESLLNLLPQDLADIIEFHIALAKFEDERTLYLMPYVQQP